MSTFLFLMALFGGVGFAGFRLTLSRLYFICQPSEVLIFAGTRTRMPDGASKGYRLIKGGSGLRLPFVEQEFQMKLSNMIIDLQVINAYSRGGIPLTVEGVANIKIAGSFPTLYNAVERLLGKSQKEIEALAKETLEGNLRGVLASLTPEQANGDQIAFAKILLEEAESDLEKLGLVLDSLQIQRIKDDVSYLDSIGRKQQAELIRDARIAEARTQSESAIQASQNDKNTALRQLQRDEELAKSNAAQKIRDFDTKRIAMVAEVEAVAGVKIAKAEAEVKVYQERILTVKRLLQADVIIPAQAECEEAIAQAKAEAAKIIETGKSQTGGTLKLAQSWQDAGSSARDIFLLQKLEGLLPLISASIPEINVDKVRLLSSQNGSTPLQITNFVDQLREGSGIDLQQLTHALGENSSALTSLSAETSSIISSNGDP